MLDELYDDVLSIMTENGFTDWVERNHPNKVSPLKWCYDSNGELKTPTLPPKGITWLANTYDNHSYYPHIVSIDDGGMVG